MWANCVNNARFKAPENWYQILTEYTKLDLSHESDIFPALQGVAQLMQSQRQTRYYAGLWEDTFLLDLLWTCGAYDNYWSNPPRSIQPEDYRAPSWSWASHIGPVN